MNFSIKPSGSQPPIPFPMTAHPSQLIIPPNESCFMAVHFAPTAIRSYTASFEAAVENGGDAASRSFSCELRGEGTLPTLTLEMPQADKGPQTLRFPRLLMVSLPVRNQHAQALGGPAVVAKQTSYVYDHGTPMISCPCKQCHWQLPSPSLTVEIVAHISSMEERLCVANKWCKDNAARPKQ